MEFLDTETVLIREEDKEIFENEKECKEPSEYQSFWDNAVREMETMSAAYPHCKYKISPNGVLQKNFGYNTERYRTVCPHNQEALVCTKDHQCHHFATLTPGFRSKGRPLPVYGPKTLAESDPFEGRSHIEPPFIDANVTEAEKKMYWSRLEGNSTIIKNLTMEKDCKLYNGSLTWDNMGMLTFRNKLMRVSAVSYILTNNRLIPPGFVIRHICLTKGCFEPTHLELGTMSQNMFEDRIRDGTLPYGENHHFAKLTEEQVLIIYRNANNETRRQLADRFGISATTIKKIHMGDTWSHVTGNHSSSKKSRNHVGEKRKEIQRSDATREYYENCMERIRKKSFSDTNGSDCINCSYVLDGGGYHIFGMLGHTTRAHIAVWEYHHNDCKVVPKDMVVRHMCDRRWCINPAHLQIGTQSDNMNDRYKNK